MRRREFLAAGAAIPRILHGERSGSARRAVAITIDDLPAGRYSFRTPLLEDIAAFRAKNTEFVHRFSTRSAPFSGFVTEGWTPRAWPEGALQELLDDWLDAGAELGNHTYSHPDLYETSLQRYQADIVLGEAALGSVLARRGRRPRYFRHPYLHTRKNGEDSTALDAFLDDAGYRTAPVTVDAQDWLFAEIYAWARARGDEPRSAAAARAYFEYLDALFDHVETSSFETLGREPVQVLLMHANALNFDSIGKVLDLLAGRGYRIASLDEALEDPVYREKVPPRGSWLHGWRELRKLDRAPDPQPGAFLGRLLKDYRIVKAAAPENGAPRTERICDG